MKTVPITSFSSYPFSKHCVRVNICQVQDFHPLKTTCSFLSNLSIRSFILLNNNQSSSSYVWHYREIWRKMFASMGYLAVLISNIIQLFLQIIVILMYFLQLLYIYKTHILVCYQKFIVCSVLFSYRPGAFFYYIRGIVTSSSSKIHGVCNISASYVGSINFYWLHFLNIRTSFFFKSLWEVSFGVTFLCHSAFFWIISQVSQHSPSF